MYIELQNAVKKYKSENVETLALNGISLGIDKGEMIAVAGPFRKNNSAEYYRGNGQADGGKIPVSGRRYRNIQ